MEGVRALRVALLDDEPFFRDLLARALDAEADVDVVGTFGTARDLIDAVPGLRPDAVIVDLVLSPGQPTKDRVGGLAAGIAVRQMRPDCGIVILSNHADPSVLAQLPPHDLQGWAYLLKRRTDDVRTLIRGLHMVADGDTMIDPAILQPLADSTDLDDPTELLTAHQQRVLALVAGGASNASIADDLGITQKSVEHAISAILDALGIDSRDRSTNPRVSATLAYLRLRGSAL